MFGWGWVVGRIVEVGWSIGRVVLGVGCFVLDGRWSVGWFVLNLKRVLWQVTGLALDFVVVCCVRCHLGSGCI